MGSERNTGDLDKLVDSLRAELALRDDELAAKGQRIARLERRNNELKRISRTSSVTGMRNLRSFEEDVQRQLGLIARGDRTSGELMTRVSGEISSLDGELAHELGDHLGRQGQTSVVYTDLVGFKVPNDEHGWEFGNTLLTAAGQLLEDCCRDTDLAYHIGGDEFALILIDCGESDAWEVVNRITDKAAEFSMDTPGGGTVGVEFYIGLAAHEEGMSMQDLRDAADAGMGAAKKKREQVHGPSR